ncbi:ABC transporter permease [Halobacteria archaeon AArc-m2/3/4]|uniref:ABC transporter permease n=1 Tax=Natronoglomus mannanivorans TaxID=2979990 RepID=A0AAP2Z102_9EURY|nr:ABC transporter permease [Halobacteria archaeon AArc-xg1-1]MCU4972158.1 ABC transporter permease [Halobacteria archaeon AArc-m2/3/4]
MVRRGLSLAVHVASADFRQRVRSRRLLVVLAAVAYFGYQFNVGALELLYMETVNGETLNYRGEPTSAYVGLTTGVTGATILLFVGYYVLTGSLERDRSTGVDQLVASTPVENWSYLLGKWLSHLGIVSVILVTLGSGALIDHLVHGVGTTNPLWIFGAVFFVGFPLGCFVAGVTVLFQSIDRLAGTLGNVVYVFGAMTLLSVFLAIAHDRGAETTTLWIRLGDTVGLFAAGEMTFDALLAVAPEYSGPAVANYGTGADGAETVTYYWGGGVWPGWFYVNRLGLVLLGVGLVVVATVPYDRVSSGRNTTQTPVLGRFGRFLPSFFGGRTTVEPDSHVGQNTSLTPVTDRTSDGFGELFVQELRLLLRGHPWWWYVGGAAIAVVGLSGSASPRAVASIAAIWPLFLWSTMGYRATTHRITPFIVSSKQPYGQLLAEWAAGVLVTTIFFGVALWPTVAETGFNGFLVLAGGVLFVPAFAQLSGLVSRTRRLFELGYLVVWYVGPLNGVAVLDFAGATGETAGTVTPLLFGTVGVVALLGAVAYRSLQV